MSGYFKKVAAQTETRFWINNVTRREADMALEEGAMGCTQNPSYTYKMLVNPEEGEYAKAMLEAIVAEEADDTEALVKLQRALVGEVAKKFMPLYEASNGQLGYVSIQGDPFNETYENIMDKARFNREAGPNIMIKIPATDNGIKAIETCAEEGIPLNCTEVMSVQQAIDVMDAYERGVARGGKAPVVYISHIAGIFDEYIKGKAAADNVDIASDVLWQAGKAVAQKVRHLMDIRCTPIKLINGGARGLQHFTEWVGCDVSNTINWKGTADKLLEADPVVIDRFSAPVSLSVVDELVTKLPDFEKAYFSGRITAEEYEEYGPVELFCSSFRRDWKTALEIVASMRK